MCCLLVSDIEVNFYFLLDYRFWGARSCFLRLKGEWSILRNQELLWVLGLLQVINLQAYVCLNRKAWADQIKTLIFQFKLSNFLMWIRKKKPLNGFRILVADLGDLARLFNWHALLYKADEVLFMRGFDPLVFFPDSLHSLLWGPLLTFRRNSLRFFMFEYLCRINIFHINKSIDWKSFVLSQSWWSSLLVWLKGRFALINWCEWFGHLDLG